MSNQHDTIAEMFQRLESNGNQQAEVQKEINTLRTKLASLERDGRDIKKHLARELAVYGFSPNEPKEEQA